MADNINVQAVRVTNVQLRPLAARIGSLYATCKQLQALSAAQGWSVLFPADTNNIADGAATDGRPIITNADANALVTITAALVTFMEQNSNANRNTVLKIAGDS